MSTVSDEARVLSGPGRQTARMTPFPRGEQWWRECVIEPSYPVIWSSFAVRVEHGTANAAWLVCAVMAFNLTRAAATTAGPVLAKATTATIRRKLIAVPGRLSSTARRLHLHLPARWPWSVEWTALFRHACGPPATATT